MRKTATERRSDARPRPAWEALPELAAAHRQPGRDQLPHRGAQLLQPGHEHRRPSSRTSRSPSSRTSSIRASRSISSPTTERPIVLGLVPLVFSLALFLLPIGRALVRPHAARSGAREGAARRAARGAHAGATSRAEVTDAALEAAWKKAAGAARPGEISATGRRVGGRRRRRARQRRGALSLRGPRDRGRGARGGA